MTKIDAAEWKTTDPLERLELIARLEDGWNGPNSLAPRKGTIEVARAFYELNKDVFVDPVLFFAPACICNIFAEWELDPAEDRGIHIYFGAQNDDRLYIDVYQNDLEIEIFCDKPKGVKFDMSAIAAELKKPEPDWEVIRESALSFKGCNLICHL